LSITELISSDVVKEITEFIDTEIQETTLFMNQLFATATASEEQIEKLQSEYKLVKEQNETEEKFKRLAKLAEEIEACKKLARKFKNVWTANTHAIDRVHQTKAGISPLLPPNTIPSFNTMTMAEVRRYWDISCEWDLAAMRDVAIHKMICDLDDGNYGEMFEYQD